MRTAELQTIRLRLTVADASASNTPTDEFGRPCEARLELIAPRNWTPPGGTPLAFPRAAPRSSRRNTRASFRAGTVPPDRIAAPRPPSPTPTQPRRAT